MGPAFRASSRPPLLAVLAIITIVVVVGALIVVLHLTDQRRPSPWNPVGAVPTTVGGASVWTTCAGRDRLYLAVGGDGFPAGPPTVLPGACP